MSLNDQFRLRNDLIWFQEQFLSYNYILAVLSVSFFFAQFESDAYYLPKTALNCDAYLPVDTLYYLYKTCSSAHRKPIEKLPTDEKLRKSILNIITKKLEKVSVGSEG